MSWICPGCKQTFSRGAVHFLEDDQGKEIGICGRRTSSREDDVHKRHRRAMQRLKEIGRPLVDKLADILKGKEKKL